jgi:hypothetical protein
MSIPEWATHIAVDADGKAWAFPMPPRFTNWWWSSDPTLPIESPTSENMPVQVSMAAVAHLLCVVVPSPHDAPTEPANAPQTHEAPP